VTATDLIDEAATWGIRPRAAAAVVAETLDQLVAAIPATPADAILADIRDQAERISRNRPHPGAAGRPSQHAPPTVWFGALSVAPPACCFQQRTRDTQGTTPDMTQ
jgi:hypothetical protein